MAEHNNDASNSARLNGKAISLGMFNGKTVFGGSSDITVSGSLIDNVTGGAPQASYEVSGASGSSQTYNVAIGPDTNFQVTSGTPTVTFTGQSVTTTHTCSVSGSQVVCAVTLTMPSANTTDNYTVNCSNCFFAAAQTFTCSDWTGNATSSSSGQVTVSKGNAQSVSLQSENCPDQSNSCNDATCSATVIVQVPDDTSYSNANQNIFCTVTPITVSAGRDDFLFSSQWTGSGSYSSGGSFSFTNNGNLTNPTASPQTVAANGGCNTLERTATISGTVNDSNACNNGESISFSYVTTQAAGGANFNPSITVNISSDGVVSSNHSTVFPGSTISYPNVQPADRSQSCTGININWTVSGTVPSGYCNTGQVLVINGSTFQEGGNDDFQISDWTGTITVNVNGTVSHTDGNLLSVDVSPTSVSSNSNGCDPVTHKFTIMGEVPEQSNHCNNGEVVTLSTTATQPAGRSDETISCSGIGVNADGQITGCPSGATCSPGTPSWSLGDKVKTDTTRNVVATKTAGATACNAGDTLTCNVNVTQVASAANSLVCTPQTLTFDGQGNELSGDTITCTVTPANSFTATDNRSWISTSTSGNVVTVTVDDNSGGAARTGTVTITHDLDSSLVHTTSISQTSGEEV